MVMEAPPSPQSVGREFVRQYYTLLNKAPNHLHRFYNHQSSFVHGGLDHPNRETQPVIGQKEIHHKIQQLNFRDCHAKITQVDSQSTLGNGVVVQVTGELSNAGQPMRRFTQTFVLAAQSPKKYYVHNDIFRYQDEIISDEECDQDSRSETEEEVVGGVTPQQEQVVVCVDQQQQQQQQIQITPTAAPFYPSSAAAVSLGTVPPAAVPGVVVPQGLPVTHVGLNGHPEDVAAVYGQAVAPTTVQPLVQQPPPQTLTGSVTAPTPHTTLPPPQPQLPPQALIQQTPQIIPQQQQPILAQQQTIPAAPVEQFSEPQQPPPQQQQEQQDIYNNMQYGISTHQQESGLREELPVNDDANDLSQEEESVGEALPVRQQSPPQQQQVSNEPKTYAYLLKSSSYGVNRSVSPPQQQQHFGDQQQRIGGGNVRMGNGRSGGLGRSSDGGKGGRGSLINSEDDRMRRNSNQNNSTAPSSTMTSSTFVNDQFQLFVGNLPHAATEDELRDIFNSFGAVLDLKVLSKAGNIASNKGMQQGGGRGPPNYGFVTYDSYQSVQRCLRAKPIYYPKDDKNGSVVNVEEKKMKDRSSFGSGGGGGGRASLPPQQQMYSQDNNRSSNGAPQQQRRMGGGGSGPMGRPPMMGGGISAGGNMNNRNNNNGYSNNSGGGRMGGRGGYNNSRR